MRNEKLEMVVAASLQNIFAAKPRTTKFENRDE